jgi:hypothetical protein
MSVVGYDLAQYTYFPVLKSPRPRTRLFWFIRGHAESDAHLYVMTTTIQF